MILKICMGDSKGLATLFYQKINFVCKKVLKTKAMLTFWREQGKKQEKTITENQIISSAKKQENSLPFNDVKVLQYSPTLPTLSFIIFGQFRNIWGKNCLIFSFNPFLYGLFYIHSRASDWCEIDLMKTINTSPLLLPVFSY